MEQKTNRIDMLNGPIGKNLLLFALPIAVSSILQQLFNSADVAVVGRFAGNVALAAVGGNSSVIALFVNIFGGLAVGVNVLISSRIGQGDKHCVSRIVHTVMTFSILGGIAIAILGQFFARPLLEAIDTPESVLPLAVLYLRIYFAGMPFIVVYNFGAAILRSVGDTKRPMYCLIVSGIINVLLNLLFVIVFQMDVAGVAIATLIANAVSTGLLLYFLMHEDPMLRLRLRSLRIDGSDLKQVFKIGTPAAIQSAVFSLSNVIIQSGINSFGPDAVGGSSTGVNFEYFTYFVINAFAQATVTFVSHNHGAQKPERCKRILKLSMLEGMGLTALMSAVFVLWGEFFVSLYTPSAVVAEYALIRMKHVVTLEALTGTYEITGAALRGMGKSMLPAVLTVIGSVVFRIVWIYTVFEKWNTYAMLMNVYPCSWVLTGSMVIAAYLIIGRRALGQKNA